MHRRQTRIHRGLVGERKLVGSRYMSEADLRHEYEAEIAPRTEAALRRILGQVVFSSGRPRRALDLGAGTGAAGRALRVCFGEDVELVAVDKVPAPGILVADVLRGVRPSGVSGCFDLIMAAHLLNELSERLDLDGRARLVAGWCRDLLEPDGTCIVIEPALRDTSRALLGVRDRLLAAGLRVAAPCFCQTACPALQRERDWCHDSAEVLVAGRSRVDFSYLVLRRSTATDIDTDRYRVVSASASSSAASPAAFNSCAWIEIAQPQTRPWIKPTGATSLSCPTRLCKTTASGSSPTPPSELCSGVGSRRRTIAGWVGNPFRFPTSNRYVPDE